MQKRRTVGVATLRLKVVLHSPVRLYSGGFSVSSLELVEPGYVVVVLHLVLLVGFGYVWNRAFRISPSRFSGSLLSLLDLLRTPLVRPG